MRRRIRLPLCFPAQQQRHCLRAVPAAAAAAARAASRRTLATGSAPQQGGASSGSSALLPLAAAGGVGVLGLTLLADHWGTGMQNKPDLGAGAAHGLLGEEFTIDANGVTLQFAKETGAETADAEVGGEGVWTGRFLWASGGELAKFIVGKGPEYWAGKRVIELGCGCGLAGLTAAAMGAKETMLTDQVTDGAATNLALNAAATPELGQRCRVSKLRWGEEEDYAGVGELPYDVIVGSDIMQEGGDIVGNYKTLADTVAALSGPKSEQAAPVAFHPAFPAMCADWCVMLCVYHAGCACVQLSSGSATRLPTR